jgi:hypothetical protein
MTIVTGTGDKSVAQDLYRSAALAKIARMRHASVYVCIGNVLARMPRTLWSLAIEGRLA